jgi:hypothetical protein
MVLGLFVCSPFNRLTRLLAWDYFIGCLSFRDDVMAHLSRHSCVYLFRGEKRSTWTTERPRITCNIYIYIYIIFSSYRVNTILLCYKNRSVNAV